MTANAHTTTPLTMPAEWETQSGVELTWPHPETDWKPYLGDISLTMTELTKAIAGRENVIIVVPPAYIKKVRERLNHDIPEDIMSRVSLYAIDTDDTWTRDHGIITLTGKDQSQLLLNFQFNGWGRKFAAGKDNAINEKLKSMGAFAAPMADHTDFVLEGGSIDSDGHGTIMTTSSCLLAKNRNQPLGRDDIDSRLRQWLGAERILWIEHGHLDGDDTDGHIDMLARFAPDDTILYTSCDDINDPQYADLKAMEEELASLRTTDGKPYKLTALPIPSPIMYDGERLPASYANFLVINGAVIVPVYGQEAADKTAMERIGKAFPGREIIGIDATTIIRQHGSIHCLTMQLY